MGKSENILKLAKITGMGIGRCTSVYDDCDGDMEEAMEQLSNMGKKKKPKDRKIFQPGDIIVVKNLEDKGKLPPDAYEYLLTYKYFKVIEVNEKLSIHIGHITPETHNPFFFSPNRFELKEGIAPVKKHEPTPEEIAAKAKEEEALKIMQEEVERKKIAKQERLKKQQEEKQQKIKDFEEFRRKEEEERLKNAVEEERLKKEEEKKQKTLGHWWEEDKKEPEQEEAEGPEEGEKQDTPWYAPYTPHGFGHD